MSVLISGVLMNPAGVPVSGAEVTFSALTNGPSVLNGFSASVMTDQDGNYAIPLEICEYAISIQSDGYNSVYGSVSINEKSTPTTINALLKLAAMEQTVTPAIIVYFREIQTDVAAKLAAIQTLNNSAAAASHDATAAKNEAAQYAQNLSAAVTQAQQARTSATASASTATAAKNAAETAAGNAQATLSDTMKKSANGSDIVSAEAFRANIGLEVQTSSTDATPNRILKLSANGEGAFGLGGKGGQRTFNNEAAQVAFMNSAANGSQIFRPSTFPASAESTLLKTYGPVFLFKSADTWGAISVGHHPANSNVEQRKGVRILAGAEGGPLPVVYDLWTNQNITLAGMYADRGSLGTTDLDTLFGSDYRGNWYQSVTATATLARNYPILSAGSLEIQYTGANIVGTVQRYTTHASNRIFIRYKLDSAGAWSAWNEIWTSANLPNPMTLDTSQVITGLKVFQNSAVAFRQLVANGVLVLNGQTPTGVNIFELGRTAANSTTVQLINTAVASGLVLLDNGSIRLSTALGGVAVVRRSGSDYTIWDAGNLANPAQLGVAQTFSAMQIFKSNQTPLRILAPNLGDPVFIPFYDSDGVTRKGWVGRGSTNVNTIQLNNDATGSSIQLMNTGDIRITPTTGEVFHGNQRFLVQGRNAVADSSGFWKTASPVINIYADGSFTATYEAEGVDVERLSEGVYKITGCQGMHPDAAWNGIDGGVSNPRCRNGQELTWNNYEVDDDGSVTVYTFHRVHSDAMQFAQNRLTLDKAPFDPELGHTPDMEWPDQTPIDVPKGLFIQVRVNMPEPEPVKPAVNHSNVYCNSVSPT
ncbi:prophage tail fiber N-terminal domain-containing protein [Pectobacterium versatile]|uniref:phage tail fiber protein n=1 Tax=Pectobacterium versatile TaxID=2488639 RepID=UPI001CCC5634|nr:prophage tail fiber N-terminal domain-containing protein [Pectobacterium versatile]